MTILQFLAWMAFAFFAGMLTTGLIGLVYLQVLKTAHEVDELCDFGPDED